MRLTTLASFTALLLMGTVCLAQSVTSDYDRTVDFSRFARFAWVRGTVVPDDINHARIVAAVDTQLRSRGFTEVEPGRADVYIAYHASFDRDLRVTGFGSGWGPYRFGGRTVSAQTETIVKGSLALDMIDARTKSIVWRAMATKEIDTRADAADRERNINRAVAKLFKSYPAGK